MTDQVKAVADGVVVGLEYTLRLDDDTEVDSSEPGEPLEFLQGQGQIISGLESALYNLTVGDEREVTVAPEDGYGERDPDAFEEVPLESFPADLELELGGQLHVSDASGEEFEATIAEIGPEKVVLDFNHPLAGETLHFHVKVVSLRTASAEELSHGHAHGAGHAHSH